MSKVIGYICLTDELDVNLGAQDVVIYPSIDAIKAARQCTSECGIMEVLAGEVVQNPMSLEEIIKRERDNNNK